jgi:hypothetical protein
MDFGFSQHFITKNEGIVAKMAADIALIQKVEISLKSKFLC